MKVFIIIGSDGYVNTHIMGVYETIELATERLEWFKKTDASGGINYEMQEWDVL